MANPPTPDHSHKFQTVDVRTNHRDEEYGTVTVVLMRCDCGEPSWMRIPGVWTMEEITGAAIDGDKFAKACGIDLEKPAVGVKPKLSARQKLKIIVDVLRGRAEDRPR